MATVHHAAFLAVMGVLLQSHVATADLVHFPFTGTGAACNEIVCGRGSCVPLSNTTFGFECVCDPGWRQARPDGDQYLNFLPCLIPNCTLNNTCGDAPPPRHNQTRPDFSFFDPCYWTDCGGGVCNRTSPFTHTCVCDEGYYNLLNDTVFPCYTQCAFGTSCPSLGFNTSTSSLHDPNSFLPDNFDSHATRLIPRVDLVCLTTVVTALARVLWKYA